MVADIPKNVERWTARRRVALVVSMLKGDTSVAEAASKHGPTVAEVEEWRDRGSGFGVGGSGLERRRGAAG